MKHQITLAITPVLLAAAIGSAAAELPSSERQQELMRLLLADCGSCHGLTMNGGLGPPLRKENLAAKPDEYIFTVIREGMAGTPMPPWNRFLNDADVRWMVDVLRHEKWKQ